MRKRDKRAIAAALTTAIALGYAVPAKAGDTLPYLGESARGENQPYQHGYRGEDFLNWNPATDPYAEYLRAKVPLQDRNEALSATQANPNLSSETQMFALSGDYGNAFFDSYPYTNEFSQYLFNFWQYTDYYGSWHGMPTEEVPYEMYQDERGVTDAWKNRKFEFGLVNLPNSAYTNAAHKNGVLSIGCIFLPRTGLKHTVLLTQDENGNFPYAEKLIEFCNYYGFDGWFINQEEDIPEDDIQLYKDFMQQIKDAGLYVQWYDSVIDTTGEIDYQNEFNELNSSFVSDGKEQYSNSIFLNYWWNAQMLQDSAKHATELGLNPLNSVFVGIEAGGDRWEQKYDLRWNLDSNGNSLNAIASLGSEFVHDGLDEDLDDGVNNNVAMRREKDEFQWMTFDRERRWWSGPYEDPSKASTTADRSQYPQDKEIGVGTRENQTFDGVAAYITERSVINGDTFVTNFNTGHGLEYKIDGSVSNDNEWSNMNIQDILPTWQWWVESGNSDKKLSVDFDYGEKYKKNYNNGQENVLGNEGKFDFDLVGAYNGGSSLVVYGDINSENILHLYKTDLDVNSNSKLSVTYNKTSNDDVKMQLAVIFEDAPEEVVKIDFADVSSSGEWKTCEANLANYSGKKIASIGLVFNGNASDYQINIGELAYTSGTSAKPATPSGLKIDSVFDTGEMYISWNLDSYDNVKQYNVYATINGKDVYMGGIYDNVYYIKDIYDATGTITIKVKAVSEDGTESDAATATYDLSKSVSNLSVDEQVGKVVVSWTAPTNSKTNLVLSEMYTDDTVAATYKTTANAGETTATIELPKQTKDYSYYTLKVTPENGETITYNGRLADNYCSAYEPSLSHGIEGYRLAVPMQKDWYKMIVTTSDGEEQTIVRYSNEMPYVKNSETYTVTLEDYTGNRSEPVSFTVENNQIVNKKTFSDVPSDSWYASAVDFVTSKGLFSGTSDDKFSPNSNMNRAMLITVLARIDGVDTSTGSTWYEAGVNWAKEKGISDGTNLNSSVSREQLTTMLYRYAGSPKTENTADSFSDADKISSWATDAMNWATATGIISGKSNNMLDPQGTATRAEVATMVMRFLSK